jgi:hypothetical protein
VSAIEQRKNIVKEPNPFCPDIAIQLIAELALDQTDIRRQQEARSSSDPEYLAGT